MCGPLAIAIAGAAVAVAGTGFSTYMAVQQANYKKKLALENQRRENARIAGAIDKGEIDQNTLGRKYASMKGAQRAAMAANGMDLSFGSAEDVQGDTAQFYREDSASLSRNTVNDLKGIDINAANYGAQATAASMDKVGAIGSGAFDIGSTVLGAVGKVGKINAAQKAGGSGWGAL